MPNKKKTPAQKTPRIRKQPEYKSFRLSKKIKPAGRGPLPGIVRLSKTSFKLLFKHKKLFIGIMLVYFILAVVFVSGISSLGSFINVKNELKQVFGSNVNNPGSILALFTFALGSGVSSSTSSTNYQTFISLIVSLAAIWSIRQVMAGEKISLKQAFYQGMYPIIPFILVLCVIGLEMIPFLIGSFLLSTVLSNGLAITVLEKAIFWIIFGLLALLSFYMVMSSLFALYISTLPDMTPMKALRSARGLVLHRRLSVALRIIGLPIILLAIYAIVLIPLIFVTPALVVIAFLALNSFSIFFVNAYLYNLYRSLL